MACRRTRAGDARRRARPRRDRLGRRPRSLLVAGASFWLGTRSRLTMRRVARSSAVAATVAAPEPRPAAARRQAQARIARSRKSAPASSSRGPRRARAAKCRCRCRGRGAAARKAAPQRRREPGTAASGRGQPSLPRSGSGEAAGARAALKPWPPRVIAGAYGPARADRRVRLAAAGQARLGGAWCAPIRRLRISRRVVAAARNSRGRHFYRFQIGTTSQAHSEVLCQRMEQIGFSCAVVGLPWKAKVER